MTANINKAPSGQNIDGIVRHRKATMLTKRPKQAAQAVHRGIQRSQTLMRMTVQKPKSAAANRTLSKLPKKSDNSNRGSHFGRIKSIPKHPKISRFNYSVASNQSPKLKPHNPKVPAQAVTATQKSLKPVPSLISSVSHQQLERLLDQALFRADAHKKSLQKNNLSSKITNANNRNKLLAGLFASLIILAVGIFFTWNNVPQVAVQVASMRTDIDATIPEYSPPGFKFEGPMSVAGNSVTMKFISNADPARTYSISQQRSDWDSQSLLTNYVEPKGADYQTTQVKGNTVYLWDNNKNATWVNNGVWYLVADQASLSSDQLLKIIESL